MKSHRNPSRLFFAVLMSLGAQDALRAQAIPALCPVERVGVDPQRPDRPPIPTISAYSVNAITDPVGERTRGETSARVVGGDQARGWLRIDVTLSAPVAAGCNLPFTILSEGEAQSQLDRGNRTDLVRPLVDVFDGPAIVEGGVVSIGSDVFVRALDVAANGTDKVALELPIQTVVGGSPRSHRLRILLGRNLQDARPMQVTVDPLPPFSVRALDAPVAGGAETLVHAEQPTPLHPESLQMPVSFSVSPAILGQFRELNRETRGTNTETRWVAQFVPTRASVMFVAGMVTAPTTGEIRVTYAGRTVSTPVTVMPGEVACVPQFTTTAVSGGVDVTLANGSSRACARYTLRVLSPAGATPDSSTLAVSTRPAISPTLARLPTSPVVPGTISPVAALVPTVARFRFSPAALSASGRVTIEAQPMDATLPPVRIEFRPTLAELALMRKK